jgi:hypothetical protein
MLKVAMVVLPVSFALVASIDSGGERLIVAAVNARAAPPEEAAVLP